MEIEFSDDEFPVIRRALTLYYMESKRKNNVEIQKVIEKIGLKFDIDFQEYVKAIQNIFISK